MAEVFKYDSYSVRVLSARNEHVELIYTDYESFENPATNVVFHRNIIDQHPMQQGCSDFLRFDAIRFVIIHYQYYAFDLFLPV